MRNLKISAVVASVIITTGVLGSHTTNSLWPWIPVSVGIAILVMLSSILYRPTQNVSTPGPILAFVTGIAVFYRAYTFTFPASMVGLDPDGYAVWTTQMIAAGSTSAITASFYRDAPIFPLINGIFSILSGIPVRDAMVIVPITVGLVLPVSVYVLTQYIPKSSVETGVIATLIIAVGAQTVQMSYWPVAQTLATVFLLLLLIVGIRLLDPTHNDKKFLILFLLFLLVLSLTHKLPIMIVALFTGAFALIAVFPQPIARKLDIKYTNPSTIWILFGLASILLFVQLAYITSFFNSVILKILAVFASQGAKISPTVMNPTAAVKPYTPPVGILLRNLHSLVLLFVGAVAWLVLAYKERESHTVQALLLASGVLFIFFPISLLAPDEIIYTRLEFFIEPILAVLIAATVIYQINQSQHPFGRILKLTSVGILVFVISAQIVTVGAAPDYPGTTRVYLTSEEVTAKEFGYQYLDNSTAGPYYSSELPFPDRHVAASGELDSGRVDTYAPLTESLYNASLLSNCPPNILYRSTDVYRFQGSWRLTWNVQSTLDGNYNRVYSNGRANHYVYAKCT